MAEPRKTARSKTTAASQVPAEVIDQAATTLDAAATDVTDTAQAATEQALATGQQAVDTTTGVASDVVDAGTDIAAGVTPPAPVVPAPAPAAVPVTPPPAAPAPAPTAAAAPVAAPTPPPSDAPDDGPPPGAEVAAAISGLVTGIKERLTAAELMLGAGALLVLGISYLLFGFILDARIQPTELAVLSSLLLLVLMGLERSQRQGFGAWYRVALVLLGVVIAGGAAYTFLNVLRSGFVALDLWAWLSLVAWWTGGVLAAIGAWMAFRARA